MSCTILCCCQHVACVAQLYSLAVPSEKTQVHPQYLRFCTLAHVCSIPPSPVLTIQGKPILVDPVKAPADFRCGSRQVNECLQAAGEHTVCAMLLGCSACRCLLCCNTTCRHMHSYSAATTVRLFEALTSWLQMMTFCMVQLCCHQRSGHEQCRLLAEHFHPILEWGLD